MASAASGAAALIAILLAVQAGAAMQAPAEETPKTHSAETHGPHWGYAGQEAPAHWGELAPEFAPCASGHAQSPIDLAETSREASAREASAREASPHQASPALEFHYRPSHLTELNNGHTIQVNYDAGSWIALGGVRYDLVQFHFHIPSEHTVGGKAFAAEVHLVHRSAQGQFTVIGLLIDRGQASAPLAPVWAHLPSTAGPEHRFSGQLDARRLLPAQHAAWRYEGSLTTPPCTEGVHWLVMESPITLSDEQLERLRGILHSNNRPVQPLNERTVSEDPR